MGKSSPTYLNRHRRAYSTTCGLRPDIGLLPQRTSSGLGGQIPSRTDTCDILQKKGEKRQQRQKQRQQQEHQQQEREQKKRRKHGSSDDGRHKGKYMKKQRRSAKQDENVERNHGSVPNKEGGYGKKHARAVQHETTTFPRPILLLLAIFLKLYIADISG